MASQPGARRDSTSTVCERAVNRANDAIDAMYVEPAMLRTACANALLDCRERGR